MSGMHEIRGGHGALFTKRLWRIAANLENTKQPKEEKRKGRQQIPWEDICEIRRLYEQEFIKPGVIAKQFNCHPGYIHQIVNYAVRLDR